MIQYLQKCFPRMMSRVAFHITYPRNLPPKYVVNDDEEQLEYNCKQPESVNREIVEKVRPEKLAQHLKRAAYPQNLLRNLAREGCPAEYSFTPDIDMISAPGMSRKLNEFVSRNSTRSCGRCAYIIPTYEIRAGVEKNPRTKGELKALLKKKKAQRFHIKVFHLNQHNSQLKKWESDKSSRPRKLEVMYNISTWAEFWEPIYVTKADVPPYDERFVS
ncbi:beta-1,4-glucuronyltransferase 1-like [Macrobrachium nipponense]|uniref:beta-1,4-glucuronyltransferase 1-like n=1 Tax=Macrobrachium nipponense TaxID=159736 RepID=UPI0030C89E52